MNENECTELLRAHGIRPTANRILIVRTLMSAERPMSLSELEYKILTIDKSSIFRALTIFRDRHMVHVIEDGGDGVRYELCMSRDGDNDDDVHAHFYCERCHRTFCIEDTPAPEIPLPPGYILHSVNYMAKGICPECSMRKPVR